VLPVAVREANTLDRIVASDAISPARSIAFAEVGKTLLAISEFGLRPE